MNKEYHFTTTGRITKGPIWSRSMWFPGLVFSFALMLNGHVAATSGSLVLTVPEKLAGQLLAAKPPRPPMKKQFNKAAGAKPKPARLSGKGQPRARPSFSRAAKPKPATRAKQSSGSAKRPPNARPAFRKAATPKTGPRPAARQGLAQKFAKAAKPTLKQQFRTASQQGRQVSFKKGKFEKPVKVAASRRVTPPAKVVGSLSKRSATQNSRWGAAGGGLRNAPPAGYLSKKFAHPAMGVKPIKPIFNGAARPPGNGGGGPPGPAPTLKP